MIRARRRQLDLTQKELAKRIKTSQQFLARLESGERRLSETIAMRLAKVLNLDRGEVFFLARPRARLMLNLSADNSVLDARKRFKKNTLLRGLLSVSDAEMEMLSRVASVGKVRSTREYLYVLNAVRIAINPALEDHAGSAWKQFKDNDQLRRLFSISDAEMEMLSRVASLGEVRSVREFLYVLNAVRQTIHRAARLLHARTFRLGSDYPRPPPPTRSNPGRDSQKHKDFSHVRELTRIGEAGRFGNDH
jgi:transcriptional regulator with XRE-family HTH domain